MSKFRLVIEKNRLPGLSRRVRRKLSEVVRKAALDIEAGAKVRAPVDTGALRNSIQSEMTGELTAEVGAGAEYAIHQEMGTRHMGAQPFLGPAVDAVRTGFNRAVSRVIEEAVDE